MKGGLLFMTQFTCSRPLPSGAKRRITEVRHQSLVFHSRKDAVRHPQTSVKR